MTILYSINNFLDTHGSPSLQYMSLPGLTLLVVNITLNHIQSVRLVWMPSCAKLLIINALQIQIPLREIFSTFFLLLSYSAASYFKILRSGFPMDLPLGISLYFKFHNTFTATVSLTVSTYCLYLWVILTLSSRWLLSPRFPWSICGIVTSLFMAFVANICIISAINGLHNFVDILLHGSFYLQSCISLMSLLALCPSSLVLFAPSNIVPSIFIISLIFHLLSTGRLIGSNLMPPVTKFRNFLLMMTPFLGYVIGFMMLFHLFIVLQ